MRPEREVSVDIGGRTYAIVSDDDYLEYVKGTFEPDMVRLFRTIAPRSDVILDIGANIGCTAILFSSMARVVHAFEPSPTTFGFLQKNLATAEASNVVTHNFGVGDQAAELTLTFSPSNRSGGFVSDQTKAGAGFTTEDIRIRRLDEVAASLELPGVDLIKIDVEGFEGHVIRGAAQTLARGSGPSPCSSSTTGV